MRAFADVFVHEANRAGARAGQVVAVQSTGSERAQLINAQGGRYHVVLRGLIGGRQIDRVQEVASISRALAARQQWGTVLEVARAPQLHTIISNTTEAGYALAERDELEGGCPASFPAKLLLVLKARYEARRSGVTVLPCELLERNADQLRALVLQQAGLWGLRKELTDWIGQENLWLNTLVDRIVSGKPDAHPLLARDTLLTVAEPYAFWAIEHAASTLPHLAHPAIQVVGDIGPFALRKVRILNGAHTALVAKALPLGIETVGAALAQAEVAAWLERVLFEEIVPTLEGKVDDPAGFARSTLERLSNPYLRHKLADIALHHDTKVKTRLVPTWRAFTEAFGREPPLLSAVLQAQLRPGPS